MDTIGKRAHQEVRNRAYKNGIAPYKEAEKLGIGCHVFNNWRIKSDPSAYYLRKMLLHGYDVIYILSGKRTVDTE